MSELIETYIVDSFTNQPFKGNPAGVCVLDIPIYDEQMLSIAKELGLSETAFIWKTNEKTCYAIRYFSPVMEIPLCGHATLAASKVLFEKFPQIETIHFENINGLEIEIKRNGHIIEMQFPVYDTIPQNVPDKLLVALGLKEIVYSAYNRETNILLLEIDSSDKLKSLTPDFEKLKRSHDSINGVLVTARSQQLGYDFESRYFWPWSGTNEDPVTGGTHTFLTKYWGERLNKKIMNSFQCSARTGFMEVELMDEKTLKIRSEAQIILQGALRL